MELNTLFEEAAAKAKSLPPQSNETLLQLYALYKQGTIGDNNSEKPGNPFDIAGMAKYNAWDELKGMPPEEAKRKYIELVNSL